MSLKQPGDGKTQELYAQTGKTWGRDRDVSLGNVALSSTLLFGTPFVVLYFWMSCTHYECSLYAPIKYIKDHDYTAAAVKEALIDKHPRHSLDAAKIYFAWVTFQALLYAVLPGKIGYGQQTPAGHILPYKVNGLLAWTISHILFLAGAFYFGWWDASIIHDQWGPLLVVANLYGYFLTFFVFLKAYTFPTHPEDRKFSGHMLYDLMMGIELNPRIGKLWDFKLFHNGRPGIIAWTLINLSFAAAQYNKIGYVTNSMILLNILHATYVLDFFYNEDWYLRTIDIAHDHFGYYLAWGDTVWLPYMYTLQSHYLVRNPVDLSIPHFLLVAAVGFTGYYIFRAVNNQKDIVRRKKGKCEIWGKPATYIPTKYVTSDGKSHTSILITSGFWGWSRHFNYVGDLLISLAMCLTCGFRDLLPYFYIIYMFILLVHRVYRDDTRCRGKYGKYWDEYCRIVPYKVFPGIW
ncbi:7773_t:CDS:2 [Ambispora gerdemannii]|uniref:7-dehydrocholesterol reductase n=1 Tax=Ambispora gerdemannii TaxID=144530 RepID=A0A9N8YM33_9GLOM|nr:7773_t:CDS:2 [Ambispora gerdemannii]